MFFKKHPKAGMKAIDKMVTGIILWGVVASVYGMKKYEDKKQSEALQNILSQKKKKGVVARFFSKLFHK